MNASFYLSLIPESLVASMLGPQEFGAYLATGTLKRPHGQAMFFKLSPGFQSEYFDIAGAERQCVPHPDGQPKHSVYLAVYRVLEHVPLDALEHLYLATAHGRVLEIQPAPLPREPSVNYHLYQEIVPVSPLIASCLPPQDFCRHITNPAQPVHVPRICFAQLDLGELADDPASGTGAGLPYPNLEHIRSCLCELTPQGSKETKTVDRIGRRSLIYRSVKSGFYVGDERGLLYYPFPARSQLEGEYYSWWHCANDAELEHAAFAL